MTAFVRRDLPADIDVFAGDFASQPLAFAHLLDAAPTLDLTHVEVIRETPPDARLGTYFDGRTITAIRAEAGNRDTLILVLPAAWEGQTCPLGPTGHLTALGAFRGTVPRMVAT
jgi:hypothetical protein